MKKKYILIVLDSYEYQRSESLFKNEIIDYCNPVFTYSEYENKIIQFFHKLPYIGGALTRLSYWWISFLKAISILVKYNLCKNKLFINPIVAIFYSFLSRIFFRTERISIAGFLFENKSNKIYLELRRWFVNFSYKKIDKIFVFSQNEVNTYRQIFPKLAAKFTFEKYGRDYHYAKREEYKNEINYISSGGRSNRDYITLCKAMESLEISCPELRCIIATRPEAVENVQVPKNTIISYNVKLNRFGSFIENSSIFILPIIDTNLSAGHMSLLEAMSLNKIIITADIPSIRDYVSEETVFFYKPEDKSSLASIIEFIYSNKNEEIQQIADNAKKSYENKYTFKAFLLRVVQKSV
jgi:glycosyltransferase involved in cell wall biosynthesis